MNSPATSIPLIIMGLADVILVTLFLSYFIFLSGTYRTVRDIERIVDYAENITEYAQYLKDTESSFSEKALGEIRELRSLLGELYEYALKAYNDEDHGESLLSCCRSTVPLSKLECRACR